jgi:putative ABC transport system ATP-binding protein
MAKDLIEVRNIQKDYVTGAGVFPALRGVSLSIAYGEFAAIMGASGSGKSTFMNVLGCLDRPTQGDYHLEGRPVSRMGSDELAAVRNQLIGFVFQGFNLLPKLDAVDNVSLPMIYGAVGSMERKRRAQELLEKVGLGDKWHYKPNQLSGGQQQRVAIARALVNRPRLILADEPTGNLDTQTSAEVMSLFTELNRDAGITVVLVTHETDIAAYASRRITFRDGLVMEDRRAEDTGAA